MQHSLVLRADGCRVREDEDFGDEFAVYFWLARDGGRRGVGVGFGEQDDHALADVFAADAAEGEGGGLPRRADGDGDAFALDTADGRGGELAEAVGADEDGVPRVRDAGFDDAGDYRADEGDGEGVVDVEFEGG
ncbi:hypothetical protein LTR38_016617, partial [Friedmanniomyces endolithicus]